MTIQSLGVYPNIGNDLDRIMTHKYRDDDVILRLMQALARQAAAEDHERALAALGAAMRDQGATS